MIYGSAYNKDNLNEFKVVFLEHNYRNDTKALENMITTEGYYAVIIPALDDIYHIRLAYFVLDRAKKQSAKVGLFWEKWRVNSSIQPIGRRLKEFIQRCLIKGVLNKTDVFWAPGVKTQQYLVDCGAKTYKIQKIHDSSICPEKEYFDVRSTYNIPADVSIILYFGRLVEYKGADILIKAFAKTSKEYRHRHFLLIAGNGPMENAYKSLAEKEEICNYCFTGAIDPKYRANFFRESDIFVLPTKVVHGKVEAWGLTINEAVQFNDIIITTDAVGAAPELVTAQNGFIIEQNNIDQLRDALMHASEKDISVNAVCSELKKEYTYEQMAFDIINAI